MLGRDYNEQFFVGDDIMKQMKHTDLDSQLWPGVENPIALFWQLSLLATILIFAISWLALFTIMAIGLVRWAFWPYLVVPISLTLILLAIPAFHKSREGALTILDAIIETTKAWMQRAGYSIDLNKEIYIEHHTPLLEPPQTEVHRPIPLTNSGGGTKMLMAKDALIGPQEMAEALQPEPRHAIKRKLWKLPHRDKNGKVTKIEQEALEEFIDQIFIRGFSRGAWCPKYLERDTYDGLIALLEQAKLIEGRKPGFAGKLVVGKASHARAVLNLPPGD